MMRLKRGGFTVLEAVLVCAILSILMVLIAPPMIEGLAMSLREQSRLDMYRAADNAMNQIATHLRPAILPITPSSKANTDKGLGKLMKDGFAQHGGDWRNIFVNGTDFVPFTIPVEFGASKTRVDSNGAPVLGIDHPTSGVMVAASFNQSGGIFTLNGNIHPYFAELNPADFNLNPSGEDSIIMFAGPRYERDTPYAPNANRAFALLHFVPELDGGGAARILREADLNFDLNDDGELYSNFAIGSIYLSFFEPTTGQYVHRILTPPMVLAQENTTTDDYVPMFQLVGGFDDTGPTGVKWTGPTDPDDEANTIMIRLLLFDELGQRTPFAFLFGGRSYLSYRFESMVTLRNLSYSSH